MQLLVDFLSRRLWSYDATSNWHTVYHWLNVAEGCLWVLVGLIVIRRYLINQRSLAEVAFAVAFVLFGISDFIEAQSLDVWLIVWKTFNLALLLVLRSYVRKHCYPNSKWL